MTEDAALDGGTNSVPNDSDGERWAVVDRIFQDAIDRGLLSGAVVSIWHQGAAAHQSAMGFLDVATQKPMTEDAIFRLYSLTKPVTAVAMMILWDEGKWKPADLIADVVPELGNLTVLQDGGSSEASKEVRLDNQPTIEHLMTHQVGFTYGFSDDEVDQRFRAAQVPIIPSDLDAVEYLARLTTVPLAFQPGQGWRYGVAMDVQGIIIERLSGLSLQEFMRQRIFGPLGMVDTDFVVPSEKRDRLAALYTLVNDRIEVLTAETPNLEHGAISGLTPSSLIPRYNAHPVLASGGGGLVSTAADYMQFGRMLLNKGSLGGRQIISKAAAAMMMESHSPAHLLTGEFGTAPHWLRPGYEYAYNGIVITDPDAAGVPLGRGTYFWDGAAGCWFWADPENDVVFVGMVQLLTEAERLSLQFRSRQVVADILERGLRAPCRAETSNNMGSMQ